MRGNCPMQEHCSPLGLLSLGVEVPSVSCPSGNWQQGN